MNESQKWHLENLMTKYHEHKKGQGYPCYLVLQEYFQEDDGPEISDMEHAEVFSAFCSYVIDEGENFK